MCEYKYKPTTWIGGKTIGTADVMNNIEDGIVKAHERLDNISFDEIVGNIDLSEYAKKTDIPTVPTNISAFTNDKGYLTSIPSEYVTETELSSKGYLTSHQDISGKADKTELHSHNNKAVLDGITSAKVAEWNNKSTFSGSYNDLSNKPTIPTKTSQLTNDSNFLTEHQDISGLATKEYVDSAITNLNIDIDYDSLLAFDTNEIITNLNYVDSDNNIVLDDDLPVGTYTLKYEFEDGTYTDIKNFTVERTTEDEPIEINLIEEGELAFNKRWSPSTGVLKDEPGMLCVGCPIDVDGNTECTLIINNMPLSLVYYKDFNRQHFVNADKTVTSTLNGGNGYFGYMTEGWTTSADEKSGTCVFTPSADMKFMYLGLMIKYNVADLTITEADIRNLSITLIIGKKGVN